MGLGGAVLMMQLAGAHPATCLRSLNTVAGGAVALATDFATAPCEGAVSALAYDRSAGVARARRDIAAGELVRGSAQLLGGVQPGSHLTVQAHIGPVVVRRQVEVLRPARAGERVIVRGDDGLVFSAPAPEAAL